MDDYPSLAELRHGPLDGEGFCALLAGPADGALARFEGRVRNQHQGRLTQYLEYEAYEELALRQMRELILAARRQWPIHGAGLLHRLGRVEIGEVAVVVAVAAGHRAEALAACGWLIDQLKSEAAIWKKEVFASGAVWHNVIPAQTSVEA